MKISKLSIFLIFALLASLVASFIVLKDDRDGRVSATGVSIPRVSVTPFTFEVAMGTYPDKTSVNKFGHNGDVSNTFETIWSGSNLYNYLSEADQLEIFSNDVDDDGGGTGAWTIELIGLDDAYNRINETIALDGTSVVTSSGSFLRIPRAIIRSAGSSGWNEGIITIRSQDDDITLALVEAKKNQTIMALDTIPAGETGYITSWYGGSSLPQDAHLAMFIRPEGEVFQIKRHVHLFRQSYQGRFDFPEVVQEKSDIEIRAEVDGGGGDMSGGFFLWLEDN